jgi:hypothetical protein
VVYGAAAALDHFGAAVSLSALAFIIGGTICILVAWTRRATRLAEQARLEYAQGLVSRFGIDAANLILAGDPWQGATKDMIQEMLGPPADVSTDVFKTRTSETWKYVQIAKNRYKARIKFENDVCVGWEIA